MIVTPPGERPPKLGTEEINTWPEEKCLTTLKERREGNPDLVGGTPKEKGFFIAKDHWYTVQLFSGF